MKNPDTTFWLDELEDTYEIVDELADWIVSAIKALQEIDPNHPVISRATELLTKHSLHPDQSVLDETSEYP